MSCPCPMLRLLAGNIFMPFYTIDKNMTSWKWNEIAKNIYLLGGGGGCSSMFIPLLYILKFFRHCDGSNFRHYYGPGIFCQYVRSPLWRLLKFDSVTRPQMGGPFIESCFFAKLATVSCVVHLFREQQTKSQDNFKTMNRVGLSNPLPRLWLLQQETP